MALNTQVSTGGRRTVRVEENDLDFSGDSEVDVTIGELRHIDSIADVSAQAYGTGDANTNEGRVVVPVAVSGNTVTLHAYYGGGAGAALDDDTTADVDHVLIEATGI